jgi:uncharacterized phage protein (TIGR02220 family)
VTQADLVAQEVFDYWSERTQTKFRAASVKLAALKRIRQRLDDGFGPDDLKRCVDFALCDDWYIERGYAKQPDVLWRSGERVQSILARVQTIARRPLPL